jgi:long-chain acyl-CoA synthetase
MPNVADAVWEHAAAAGGRTALLGADPRGWTYAGLRDAAAAMAGAAAGGGVAPGDRVMIVAPSVPEFVAAYFGLQAAGAVVVTANTMATRAELEYVLHDAGCSLVVAWHGVGPAAQQAAAAAGLTFWRLRPGLPDIDGGAPARAPHDAAWDDTAVILYTSGTTGRPKGAQLTQRNLRACAKMFREAVRLGPDDVFGTALPLFHVFGQAVVLGGTMLAGGSLSLLERFEPDALLRLVRRDRVSVLAGVPTMYNALLRAGTDAGPQDFASLRLAASGGASLPAEVIRGFGERFGCVILEGYGLTETTGAVTFNGLERERKVGAVGVALPGVRVRIARPDGSAAEVGEVGEVRVSGPIVMKGYWRRPEATAEALDGEWLRTGDLGAVDEDGDLRIVDRKKDLIIRGGYNVYPREVEEVLYEHPDIVEVAVVGVPDEHYGEEVSAVVVLRAGATLRLDELRAWAKERLSGYKVPRLLQVVDSLPKGPTGKVLKRAIDLAGLTSSSVPAGQSG